MAKYEPGDYVKTEFKDASDNVGEWMWVRVIRVDDQERLVFGTLDNEPLMDYGGKLRLGAELAVSYDRIRDHRKPSEWKARSSTERRT